MIRTPTTYLPFLIMALALGASCAFTATNRDVARGVALRSEATPWFRQKIAREFASRTAVAERPTETKAKGNDGTSESSSEETVSATEAASPEETTEQSSTARRLWSKISKKAVAMAPKRNTKASETNEGKISKREKLKEFGKAAEAIVRNKATAAITKIRSTQRSRVEERNQRALLVAQLKTNGASVSTRTTTEIEKETSMKPAAKLMNLGKAAFKSLESSEVPTLKMIPVLGKDEKQATKYASIDCLEERAFTILKDLNMVDSTTDFSI